MSLSRNHIGQGKHTVTKSSVMHRRHLALVILFTALPLVAITVGYADEPQRCAVCGMDVSKYPHTRYIVRTADGKQFVTCGVQCGLTLHLRLKENWKSASATDLLSNRAFDAAKGFYVFKSSVIADMAPGFIAFKQKSHAENLAKGFGGQVVSYEQALSLWKKRME
jgi:nitrous oxide reductase accessory protein NosL